MIKKIKQLFVTALATSMLLAPLAMVPLAHAETSDLQGSLCSGTNINLTKTDSSCLTDTTADTQVNDTVKLALNLFSAIVGIIAVVMIIVGGIKYITSGGDSGNVTAAKNTILYAVIGLVVVALAQIIVKFVLGRFVGNGA
ncbi:MAG: pilin [Candidatus Saccharibacteria bacterium]|nr:pilin [Candidatus Saccharibacteria bacterium]